MAKSKDVPIRPFAINCGGPSKTVQSHAEGNSVAEIVGRYRLTGTLPQSSVVPQFFDTTKMPSLVEALTIGAKFNFYFSSLDATLRDRFRNDPKNLMLALGSKDPKVISELKALGILTPDKAKPGPVLGSKENPLHSVHVDPDPDPPADPPANKRGSAKP